MEELAYQIMTLGETRIYLLVWAICSASAGLAVAATKLEWKLHRAPYFLSLGFTFVFMVGSVFILTDLPNAIQNGYSGQIIGSYFVCIALAGGLLGIFSAARANDAYDTRGLWFLSVIPIANLFLLFTKSMTPKKTGSGGFIANAAIVFLGLMLFTTGRTMEKHLSEIANQTTETGMTANNTGVTVKKTAQKQPVVQDIDIASDTVSDVADNAVNDTVGGTVSDAVSNSGIGGNAGGFDFEPMLKQIVLQTRVPQKLSNIMTLIHMEAKADRLISVYEMSSKDFTLSESVIDFQMFNTCNPASPTLVFELGLTRTNVFVDTEGKALGEVSANPVLCEEWSTSFDTRMEERAADETRQLSQNPQTTGDGVTLTHATYRDKTYIKHYTVPAKLSDKTRQNMEKNWCETPYVKGMMSIGLTLRLTSNLKDGSHAGDVVINKAICNSI
jgi:hypothetical protein